MAYQRIPVRTINSTDVVPVINAAPQAMTTGTITAIGSTIVATDLQGIGSATVTFYGTHAGVNAVFEVYDGVNWVIQAAQQLSTANPAVVIATGVITTNATIAFNVSPLLGVQQVRVRATAYTSGTANVIIEPSTQFVPLIQTVNGTLGVSAVTPGVAATSLGKAEDAAVASGDTGVFTLSVRRDAAVVSASATGDYSETRVDQYGQRVVVPGVAGATTVTRVTSAATTTSLLAANLSRKGAYFFNESTAILYLKFGATASVTSYTVQIVPSGYYELPTPVYSGAIDGIWASANGAVQITESI